MGRWNVSVSLAYLNNLTVTQMAFSKPHPRLKDIRTSSPHDAAYRDNFQPYTSSSSLLVYGTERFLAGSDDVAGPCLRFFDFRYPKPYHHTSVQSCSEHLPRPGRPDYHEPGGFAVTVSQCDANKGIRCRWHAQSERDLWRPDITMYLTEPRWDGVTSLAKASDVSDTFYVGVRGAVVENTLRLTEDVDVEGLKATSAPPGWEMEHRRLRAALIETGVSLCSSKEWLFTQESTVPQIMCQKPWEMCSVKGKPGAAVQQDPPSRLDSVYSVGPSSSLFGPDSAPGPRASRRASAWRRPRH